MCVSTSVTLFAMSACGRPPPSVKEAVRQAKSSLEQQSRLADYHSSPFQPSVIVERIHDLGNPAAWADLCGALEALPDDELELFEDEIRKPEHAAAMPCASGLLARIADHWRRVSESLEATHPIGSQPVAGGIEKRRIAVDTTRSHVIVDGDLADGEIALTFDDGPHRTRTPRILEILRKAGIEATFFQIGRNAVAHPEIARSVAAAGHSVGSHTFSHPELSMLPERHAETEIEAGDASVSLALGFSKGQLPFFRFPYGAKTATELAFVERRGNTIFSWNMDSLDWRLRDPHALFLNVLHEIDRAKKGIILFHDIHEQTVIVLPHVLAELRARKMKAVVFVATGPLRDHE